jgi:surfeit locus 1 family protein
VSRRAGLVAVALVVAAGCVRLGVWQLERRDERRAANVSRSAALARPPLELRAGVGAADSAAAVHRRAAASGVFDLARERIVPQRSWRGSPGVGLLAPLVLHRGGEVWVDRGWAPAPDASTLDPAPYAERGPVRVEGFLRPPTSRERRVLAGGPARAPDAVPPLLLQQLPVAGSVLRRAPLAEPGEGPHLSYAIQWFAFAAIALGGAAAWVAAQRREPPARPGGPSAARTDPLREGDAPDGATPARAPSAAGGGAEPSAGRRPDPGRATRAPAG